MTDYANCVAASLMIQPCARRPAVPGPHSPIPLPASMLTATVLYFLAGVDAMAIADLARDRKRWDGLLLMVLLAGAATLGFLFLGSTPDNAVAQGLAASKIGGDQTAGVAATPAPGRALAHGLRTAAALRESRMAGGVLGAWPMIVVRAPRMPESMLVVQAPPMAESMLVLRPDPRTRTLLLLPPSPAGDGQTAGPRLRAQRPVPAIAAPEPPDQALLAPFPLRLFPSRRLRSP